MDSFLEHKFGWSSKIDQMDGVNYTILDKILFHLLPCLEILLLDLEGLMEYLELKMFGSLVV